MDTVNSLAVVGLAALVHASFQLSISVLTLLSSHAIGSKKSSRRVLGLTSSFVSGAGIMTLLLISFSAFIFSCFYGNGAPAVSWAVACGLVFGVGIAIWLFYYRRSPGTTLWLPRGLARYLSDRTKVTKNSAESFALGLTSVTSEIIFIAAPIVISGLTIANLTPGFQIIGVLLYTVISLLGLVAVWVLIGSGHSLSMIQKWREANKGFLQFISGGGLIVLSFFVYVSQIIGGTRF